MVQGSLPRAVPVVNVGTGVQEGSGSGRPGAPENLRFKSYWPGSDIKKVECNATVKNSRRYFFRKKSQPRFQNLNTRNFQKFVI